MKPSARRARPRRRRERGIEAGKPVWVAWTLDDAADGTLRSGETVAEAYHALSDLPVAAFLFNCSSIEAIARALPDLRALTDKPIGAYANAFQPLPQDYVMGAEGEVKLRDLSPEAYLACARSWRDMGADIIGGCCGIGPGHIEVLREGLH